VRFSTRRIGARAGLGPTNADADDPRAHFTKELNALADIYYRQRLAAAAPTETPLAPEVANTAPKKADTEPNT
jgi:hypothetical protein